MHERIKLLLLFLAISTVILVRVAVEPNGFTTPDSIHYLKAAEALLESGQLEYPFKGRNFFYTSWPMGYSLSIATLTFLTPFSLLISSKLVNLLWLGLGLVLFYKLFPKNAFWIGLIFCANSLLNIFSYTWSEGGFMVLMLWFSIALHHFLTKPQERSEWASHLFFSIITTFLYRYFGGFLLGVLSIFGVYFLWRRNWKTVGLLLCIAAGAICFMAGYFLYIKQNSGYYAGQYRPLAEESILFLLKNLVQTQLNEVLVIRKLNFHALDKAALFFLGVQSLLTFFVIYRIRKIDDWKKMLIPTRKDDLPLVFAFTGICYWLGIVTLRFFVHFDMFDFRLIAPASFLLLVSIHSFLTAEHRKPLLQKIQTPITFLYLLALAHGLYKQQLLLLFVN